MVNEIPQGTNGVRTAMRTPRDSSTNDGNDDIEMQHLLDQQGNHTGGKVGLVKAGAKKPEGFFQRHMTSLDERLNVKMLMRAWKPRLESVVRLMLVATFLDDSLHTAISFSEHTNQVGKDGCLNRFATTSPELVAILSTVALGIGLVAQSLGSFCLLALLQPDCATKALIGWTIAQPVLYGQLSNAEFVAESLSLVGGLLTLRAHLVPEQATRVTSARVQLLGRLLLPAMHLHYAGRFLFSALALDETTSLAAYVSSLSMFVVRAVALVALAIGSAFVAAGLKSRLVASLLALVNIGCVFRQHPFFRFVRFENGKWEYDEDMAMPRVALPTDIAPDDFYLRQVYDLHRYYFFLGLSTSGALLLLAQFGPGEIAVHKDEVLLPVAARAQD
mmetsp:Transcript_1941/g.2742  ORF Transcript_1941/g.2742 Transcript_1941/m.2742 type:complete len:389 (-) Transcript_1941:86-1252(-)